MEKKVSELTDFTPRYRFQEVGYADSNTISSQVGGTCYAHAAADIITMSYSRIIGIQPHDPEILRQMFIKKFGIDGGYVTDCVKIFPFLNIEHIDIKKAITFSNEKVPNNGWQTIFDPISYSKKNVVLSTDVPILDKATTVGHALVCVDIYSKGDKHILQLKNSWNKIGTYSGVYHVDLDVFPNYKFYSVHFFEGVVSKDPTLSKCFQKYGEPTQDYLRHAYKGNNGKPGDIKKFLPECEVKIIDLEEVKKKWDNPVVENPKPQPKTEPKTESENSGSCILF